LSAIGELPVYAVGAASARFAENCGLNVVAEGNAGAIELAELMAKELTKGARVGYLCGKVRHPDFESRMQALGFVIKPVEIYDTIQVSYLTKSIGETLGDCPLDAVLLHSAESAAALDELLARVKPGQITDNTHYFCFSERIAAKLTSVVKSRIVISARPNDAALIVAVKKIFG
jgi:uroporphyrinogen-III synthase